MWQEVLTLCIRIPDEMQIRHMDRNQHFTHLRDPIMWLSEDVHIMGFSRGMETLHSEPMHSLVQRHPLVISQLLLLLARIA